MFVKVFKVQNLEHTTIHELFSWKTQSYKNIVISRLTVNKYRPKITEARWILNDDPSTCMPSPERLSVTLTFMTMMTFKLPELVDLSISDLVVTSIFDLLTATSNQFIFVPNCSWMITLVKFPNEACKMSRSRTFIIIDANGHTDSLKTACLPRLIAGEDKLKQSRTL